MPCSTTVHDNVCVDAEVTITPVVTVGDIRTFCLSNPVIGRCSGTPTPNCSFHVRQEICVQVPLTFEAEAAAVPQGIVCGAAGTGLCSSPGGNCTFTIGYFRNHEEVLAALLLEAGGSIVLGNSITGLGTTVTTVAEAVNILSFNAPTAALPTNNVFAVQYGVLYAQLLGAKLNILNGATCTVASTAIAAADQFLATSPPEGVAGAPDIQSTLADYNQGNAEGCPEHCE